MVRRCMMMVGLVSMVLSVASAQECVLNDSQCTCIEREAGVCMRDSGLGDGTCEVSNCESSWMCDCTGFNLCDIVPRTHFFPLEGSLTDLAPGTTGVACESKDVTVPVAEEAVCAFAGQDCIQACLWSVKVEGTAFACILAIPIDVSVAEWYGYTSESSQTSVIEGLRADYANIRITNTTANNDFFFCTIYSNGAEPDDGTGLSRRARAEMTANYALSWQVEDDPPTDRDTSDTYSTNSTDTISSLHQFKSNKSDGFCVGPMDYRAGAVIVQYSDLVNVIGLHFQAWDGETNEIVTLETFDLVAGQDSVGPIILRPNCFADCLASIGEI